MLKKRQKDPLENSENVSYIKTLRHYGASSIDMISDRSSSSDLAIRFGGGTMMKNRIRDLLGGQKNSSMDNIPHVNHRRIASLDQLYAAAVCLQPVLIEKVRNTGSLHPKVTRQSPFQTTRHALCSIYSAMLVCVYVCMYMCVMYVMYVCMCVCVCVCTGAIYVRAIDCVLSVSSS